MYMKKYVEHFRKKADNEIKIVEASSKKDRIQLKTGNKKVTSTINEKGEIEVKVEDLKKIEFSKKTLYFFSIIEIIIFVIFCFINIKLNIANISVVKGNFTKSISYILVAGLIFILEAVSIINVRIKGKKDFLKNHGAEHMTLMAFKKLGYVPSCSQIKQYSRFSPKCGIGKISSLITWNLIGFAISYFLGLKISIIILLYLGNFMWSVPPFYFLGLVGQIFTTAKPDDQNIILAREALLTLVEEEKKSS